MFVLGNFFIGLARALEIAIPILYWLILVRALISWVNPDPFNPIVQFLNRATDPILAPIRRFMPTLGPFDISPVIAILILIFLQKFLVLTLIDFGTRLKF
ncbi:MAG: YggT family protein [Candidatus Omnitrophota bacterium]